MSDTGPGRKRPAETWDGLRRRARGDDARIVEIYTQQEADSWPLSLARYRAEQSASRGEQWVARALDQVVGVGSLEPAWWTGQVGVYSVEIRIAESHWRRGIGSQLYELLRARLRELDATRLVGWVRADAEPGRRFAARYGFRETGTAIEEYRLRVPDATVDAHTGLEERLKAEGVRIASLAELTGVGGELLEALQRLWAELSGAAPGDEELRRSFATWRREVLDAPGLSPQTHWIALEARRPIGMTFLKTLSADAAENDFTGVTSAHRGRGIAQALKLRTVDWARRQGVTWFYTSSALENTAMIAINTRLGYRPGVRRLQLELDLA